MKKRYLIIIIVSFLVIVAVGLFMIFKNNYSNRYLYKVLLNEIKETKKHKSTTYLTGVEISNYIWYNGFLWKAFAVDDNNNVLLITNESITIKKYNDNKSSTSYLDSDIRNYLNNNFYNNLNSSKDDIIIYDYVYCLEEDSNFRCNISFNDKISLMGSGDYTMVAENLNNNTNWLLRDNYYNKNDIVNYVSSTGEIKENNETYYSGIRPIIAIKNNVKIKDGNGSYIEPFTIKSDIFLSKNDSIKTITVGNYILYDNYKFRVIENNNNKIKVILSDFRSKYVLMSYAIKSYVNPNFELFNPYGYDNIASYLNNDFEIDKTKILKNNLWVNGVVADIGLPTIEELFSNQDSFALTPYWLLNDIDNNIFCVNEIGEIVACEVSQELIVKPVLYLDSSLNIISGNGSYISPYLVK